jgi:hypothetical protein
VQSLERSSDWRALRNEGAPELSALGEAQTFTLPVAYTMLIGMRINWGSPWRKVLAAAALVAAVGEALDAISIGWPALMFAGLFAIGLAWLLRGGRGGVILIGVLMLLEVAFWPSYERNTTAEWAIQTFFLVLGAVGTVAAVGELWTSRRSASAKASASAPS